MHCPENALYIIVGEINAVLTSMRRSNKWSSHTQEEEEDGLLKSLVHLKKSVTEASSCSELDPVTYLSPFLDVIRSENTTGVVTCHGLGSVYKFLSYGLIDEKNSNSAVAAENIAGAVTHARFLGTDAASDEVVLMKIIQVLRLLLLSPLGCLLTNESVCEIIQSFFRICFEIRFSEILRRIAETALVDAVQLLFSSLPQFTEDYKFSHTKKLKICSKSSFCENNSVLDSERNGANEHPSDQTLSSIDARDSTCDLTNGLHENKLQSSEEKCVISEDKAIEREDNSVPLSNVNENLHPIDSGYNSSLVSCDTESELNSLCDTEKDISESSTSQTLATESGNQLSDHSVQKIDVNSIWKSADCNYLENNGVIISRLPKEDKDVIQSHSDSNAGDNACIIKDVVEDRPTVFIPGDADYVNPRGVRFTLHETPKDGTGPLLIPYGLPCVKELLKLFVTLINPQDKHNTELTIQIGLNLITVALEAGADHLGKFASLLGLVRDEMCRNLFSLLSTDRLSLFSSCLRIFFLLFEALRTHLKFQLEMFLVKLMEIIVSESIKISYEQRQMSLDCINQMFSIPGLITELYINYDCDLYCANLFEDLTKMLSKNAFSLTGLYSVHLLSLDALLAIVKNIERNCHCRVFGDKRTAFEKPPHDPNDTKTYGDNPNSDPPSKELSVIERSASGYRAKKIPKGLNKSTYKISKYAEPVKHNRMSVSQNLPSHEEIMAIKHKKKILASGTEQFNGYPSKGISFLQEHELLVTPLNAEQVAAFLRNNPSLSKKMIGEYISNRKNLKVLEAFVRSFSFENTRIDEALRKFLETFRLPGEAPLISLIMEHFAEHWHRSNKEPFANNDAAFTLSYAVIMLNVDQHNNNVKKQSTPMTVEDFKKNLKKVNGGEDFDEQMLEQIFNSIKSEEIVMPAEQTGLVRDNYLWKVLLRRGNTKEGKFFHTPNGMFDHNLFCLTWGPTVAALSFVFDKSSDTSILMKAVTGFYEIGIIAAHYKMCDVFDNLIISICKFTSLVNVMENLKTLVTVFGTNKKAQIATKTAFNLANMHRDILREGWKNLIDCMLNLFKARLLPEELLEAEDFINPNGVISLIREEMPVMPRTESGLFSSFYSYITDSPSQRILTQEDELAKQAAIQCIKECHCEQLITESKFFEIDSLAEMVKTLLFLCRCPEPSNSPCNAFDEDISVFLLEILIKIVLLNRDRVLTIWPGIQEHLFRLVMNSAITESRYLLERSVVGILRIAVRLIRKEHMISQVLQSLQVLLILKPAVLVSVSRQVAFAMHELLRTNAANIHRSEHWSVIFTLLERVGAGAKLMQKSPSVNLDTVSKQEEKDQSMHEISGAQSDSELTRHTSYDSIFPVNRGYTSDSELYESQLNNSYYSQYKTSEKPLKPPESPVGQATWIMVNKEGEIENTYSQKPVSPNQYNIIFEQDLAPHDTFAFLKCCESLAFLIRDVAHITAENYESCVHCIRTFVEASVNGGYKVQEKRPAKLKHTKEKKVTKNASKDKMDKIKRSRSESNYYSDEYDADDDEEKLDVASAYQQASLQLLDLMHTLHTRTSTIFGPESNVPNEDLWNISWCPLLQGIARLCCDTRRSIRTSALTLLPRALLVHDLKALSAAEWEACFNKVLFPLLAKLLEDITPDDPLGMEETRMRGATLLCKVFLQHLIPLLSLPTFMALWLTILDFMDKYMHVDGSGLLTEAIPESLKNMLLVMDTSGVFKRPSEDLANEKDQMWDITWDRINTFLPGLQKDVFKSESSPLPINSNSSVSTEITNSSPGNTDCSINIEDVNVSSSENVQKVDSTSQPLSTSPLSVSHILQEDSFQKMPSVSVILHPPVTPITYTTKVNSTSTNCSQLLSSPISSPIAVPLLLDPIVMNDASVPMFNTQNMPSNALNQ